VKQAEEDLLTTVLGLWAELGGGGCIAASFVIRHLLAVAGVDSEPLTVQAVLRCGRDDATATVGALRPRTDRRTNTWTGHEIVHVSGWGVVVHAALGQSLPGLGVVEPVLAGVPSRLRPGDQFSADVPTGESFGALPRAGWTVSYVVAPPNYDYRRHRGWPTDRTRMEAFVASQAEHVTKVGR